ncbi:MAG: DUF2807 domain-containing protein [Ferruginibacter sp.]
MKKLIVMAIAILLTGCITAFASGTTQKTMPRKNPDYQMAFSKIIVADDIYLQLKESDKKIIHIGGKSADIENVDWRIKGKTLFIKQKRIIKEQG